MAIIPKTPDDEELEKILVDFLQDHADRLWNLKPPEIKTAKTITALKARERRIVQEAKREVLNNLLEWHDMWNNRQEFNWYGAVKAMLVMKDPMKPFIQLKNNSMPDETKGGGDE